MGFEQTATRLWKRLSREERLAAATAFWEDTPPELVGGALGAIVSARRVRPQVARTMPAEARAQALCGILEPGETLAASLLVALHLARRRPMLSAFLDALGLPHENGILKDEAESEKAPTPDTIREAVRRLLASFPRAEVELYLNTLWLQDKNRWAPLAEVPLS